MVQRRTLLAHAAVAVLTWTLWLVFNGGLAAFDIIAANWPISLTMAPGSFIAGATSEGGGAIAFPVFTKLLEIAPADARTFSLAIQSVGMTAASLVIIAMGIRVDWWVIRNASLAGIPGIILGSAWLAPQLSPAMTKLAFTALVTSFAFTLFRMNRGMRLVHMGVPQHGSRETLLVMLAGFCGGVMSGLVGNGIDIITFSLMVLLFRVCEKVATPTSVILMAANSLVGFALHGLWLGNFTPEVQAWWLAAVPIVVIGAPLGAIVCSMLDRALIANILIGLITIEFISSLLIIPMTPGIMLFSSGLLILFSLLYWRMSKVHRYIPQADNAAGAGQTS